MFTELFLQLMVDGQLNRIEKIVIDHESIAIFFGSLSKRTDAKILIIIFKLLDESLIVFCFK